jgi:hypothetical protein
LRSWRGRREEARLRFSGKSLVEEDPMAQGAVIGSPRELRPMKPTDPKADPNATIQINLDEISLLRPEDAPPSATPGKSRTPPPLPAFAQTSAPPGAPNTSTPPINSPSVQPSMSPRSRRSGLLLLAVFVVLLAVVITAGAKLGFALRATPPAPSAAAPPSAAPPPASSVISIKTIDLQDPTAPADSTTK